MPILGMGFTQFGRHKPPDKTHQVELMKPVSWTGRQAGKDSVEVWDFMLSGKPI